jgi:hypothetical protein
MQAVATAGAEPWELFSANALYKKSEVMLRTGWSARTADTRLAGVPSALWGQRDRRWRGADLNEALRLAFERGKTKATPVGVVGARLEAIRAARAARAEKKRLRLLPREPQGEAEVCRSEEA